MEYYILQKYKDEFYLGSLVIEPKVGDQIIFENAINIATEENLADSVKVIKSTVDSTLNLTEIQRLVSETPEYETNWLVGYTKQNYLKLI